MKEKRGFFGKLTDGCVSLVSKYLPDAFIFAVILTIFVFIVTIPASGVAASETVSTFQRFVNIIFKGWYGGFWSLLAFSMQMALVVVTGSILANTPQVKRGLVKLAKLPKTPGQAVWMVAFIGIIVAF
ncbi:MAG: TIGR00366 family protein, partial [Bacilli bacterium]|nr:TIGR00366 family protein [Bacilli bacterium]